MPRSPRSTSPNPHRPHSGRTACQRQPGFLSRHWTIFGPSLASGTVATCSVPALSIPTRRRDMSDAATYRDLAEAAWSWTLDQVRDDDGPWLPESIDEAEPQIAATW